MKNRLGLATAIPAALLIVALLFTLAFACSGLTASADEAKIGVTPQDTLTFGQMSDIHYFPLEHCYDADAEDYTDSDFYHSTTGDTKLVIESGAILDAHVDAILADARAGKAPQYLFATGDLSKNGERVALIDVANKLRDLQNKMRGIKGYENFQVFAVQGNHDLYNGSGKLYDEHGNEYQAEVVTSAQFALIFAGLGYPDMTEAELEKIYPSDYWSSSYTNGYIESTTAGNVTITYFNQNLQNMADNEGEFSYDDYTALFNGGETVNALSYYVEFTDNDNYGFFVLDGTDREMTEDPSPVRVSEAEYTQVRSALEDITTAYNAANGLEGEDEVDLVRFYLGEENLKAGIYTSSESEIMAAFDGGGTVYADTGYDHLTGGRLTEPLLDWMRGITAKDPDKTYVGAYHFNVLPHFEQEDDILKDFVFYNWEYIAKEFLKMGVRYGISGHMHASDVAYYHDAAGRTFYDIQTGSAVSYASPRRYMTIERYTTADNEAAEKFFFTLHILDSFEGMNSSETYADYNDYISGNIYGQLVERVVDHFITMRTIDDLDIPGLVSGLPFGIGDFVEYLVGIVKTELYPNGYPGFEGQTQPTDLMDYIKKGAAQELIGMKFGAEGNELTLAQIFSFIMMAHAAGVEPTTAEVFEGELPAITGTASEILDPLDPVWRARYIAALRDFAEKCDSGQLARDLFGILLDTLYYDEDSILKTLFEHEINLTESGLNSTLSESLVNIVNNKSVNSIRFLLNLAGLHLDDSVYETIENAIASSPDSGITVSKEAFVLNDALNALWPIAKALVRDLFGINLSGDTLYEGVDGLLDSYLTDSFYVGLSGIAKNIVIAYATDDEIDLADKNNPAGETVLTPHPGYADGYAETLTYVSGTYAADEYNAPTQDNGRLPSHLTANFLPSDKTGGKFAVSFYTSEEIGAEVTLTTPDGIPYTVSITEADLNASEDTAHRTVTKSVGDVNASVTLTGGTYAQYIPLIDLGLLTISHTETGAEDADGNFTEYVWGQRDDAPANSVIYKNRWVVVFENLTFGTEYTYTVRGVYQNGEVSKVFDLGAALGTGNFTFTSAPSETTTDFDFIAIADMQGMIQSMYEDSAAAIEAIMANAGGYDFVLNAGDMADNGDNFSQWGWALNENLDFFANTSTFNTAGNHEDGGGKLDDFYNYGAMAPEQDSDSGLYYSFDYATAHVIVLNTNDADATNGISDTQLEWLKADLEANKDAKWIFVLMHKSLYSGGSHSFDGDVEAMRAQLVPVFYEYGVDLVLAGHDHTYTVTECLDGNGDPVSRASYNNGIITMDANGSGVMYVTLGTIGTKFYDYVSNSEIEDKFNAESSVLWTLAEQTFAKISVRGDTLTYTGYTVNADGTLSVIYTEPTDDLLLVKILVPIAGVILIAGVVVAVVLVKKNKAKKAAAAGADADVTDDGGTDAPTEE